MTKSNQPAPRNINGERTICDAIKQKKAVRIRYESEFTERVFHPYVVYESTTGKILVSGTQVKDLGKPFERSEPHKFEIGKISSVTISDDVFAVDRRFDRNRREYARIICIVSVV